MKEKNLQKEIEQAEHILKELDLDYSCYFITDCYLTYDDLKKLIKILKEYIRIKKDSIKLVKMLKEVDKKCCGK